MFRFCSIASLICSLTCSAWAQIPAVLADFVRRAVENGEIKYWGALAASRSTYHVFTLEQAERKGVLLVRELDTTHFEIVWADTSFDSFPSNPPEGNAVAVAAAKLLNGRELPLDRTIASSDDICPLGASLNNLLGPIAGFTLSSNGTLGILRQLQHSDAYSVDPGHAPPGSVLVCPSRFAAQGPVTIGFVVIAGPDRCVYGPDYRAGGAWHRLGTLSQWVQSNQAITTVSGFLLRAKE
jgi:hypothetical protein